MYIFELSQERSYMHYTLTYILKQTCFINPLSLILLLLSLMLGCVDPIQPVIGSQQRETDYSVFMSSKAVKLLFDTAKQVNKFEKLQLAVANTMVMSVGPKTTKALENEGIKVNYQATTFSSVGIGEVFTKIHAVGKKVIVPRSGASTPFLKELLNKIGIDVKEIHLYDVCAFRDTTQWNEFRTLFSQDKIDGIVFTSASSVRAFFEIMSKDYDENKIIEKLEQTHVVAIGPFTADELKKFNVKNTISEVHTVPGSFDTMKIALSN